MIKKVWATVISFCLLLLVSVTHSYADDIPSYDGPVNDFAQILSADFETELENELTETAAASAGAELAIVTITSLQGDTIENVAQEFFDRWQIGKAELDNGVLLIAAMEERKIRIQTGYGAEPVITDAEAGRIIRNQISPAFKKGEYETGIRAGVDSILSQFESSPGFTPGVDPLNKSNKLRSAFQSVLWISLITIFFSGAFIYVIAWLGRTKAWWPGGLVGLGIGLFIGITPAVFFGLSGLFLDYILSKNYKKWKLEKKTTNWKDTWGGFHHSSGSSSSSSSGGSSFSFGGGSSGGGGASGGW